MTKYMVLAYNRGTGKLIGKVGKGRLSFDDLIEVFFEYPCIACPDMYGSVTCMGHLFPHDCLEEI